MCHQKPTVQRSDGCELEYRLKDNTGLHCIHCTVAQAVRNSNKVSQRNILAEDQLHMVVCSAQQWRAGIKGDLHSDFKLRITYFATFLKYMSFIIFIIVLIVLVR